MTNSQQKTIRPFVFEESFDVISTPEEIAEIKRKEIEEAPPTFSEEELQAARDEAYQMGLQAGLQEAGSSIEQQVATTLEVLTGTLNRIDEQQKLANEILTRESIDLAISAVRKLLPDLAERGALAEIEAFVGDIMAKISETPNLIIRVAENLVPDVDQQVSDLCSRIGFSGSVSVVGDGELGAADCRIRWNEGEAFRKMEITLAEIEGHVAALPRATFPDTDIAANISPPVEDASTQVIDTDMETTGAPAPDRPPTSLDELPPEEMSADQPTAEILPPLDTAGGAGPEGPQPLPEEQNDDAIDTVPAEQQPDDNSR